MRRSPPIRVLGVPFSVEKVHPSETFPLRRQVLRPGRSPERILLAGEDSEVAGSFVAREVDTGSVLSTGSTWPEPPPWVAGSPTHDEHGPEADHGPAPYEVPDLAVALTGIAGDHCWRLRGMATVEDRRGEGLGAAVLEAIVEHARANGGNLIWCTARERAVAFYERAGFSALGQRFDEKEFGPHLLMWKAIEEESA